MQTQQIARTIAKLKIKLDRQREAADDTEAHIGALEQIELLHVEDDQAVDLTGAKKPKK